jgi:hypothetical protein
MKASFIPPADYRLMPGVSSHRAQPSRTAIAHCHRALPSCAAVS